MTLAEVLSLFLSGDLPQGVFADVLTDLGDERAEKVRGIVDSDFTIKNQKVGDLVCGRNVQRVPVKYRIWFLFDEEAAIRACKEVYGYLAQVVHCTAATCDFLELGYRIEKTAPLPHLMIDVPKT